MASAWMCCELTYGIVFSAERNRRDREKKDPENAKDKTYWKIYNMGKNISIDDLLAAVCHGMGTQLECHQVNEP